MDKLKTIKEKLNESNYNEQNKYFALNNIKMHLHLYYGSEYNIAIESELNKGTIVFFDIPL